MNGRKKFRRFSVVFQKNSNFFLPFISAPSYNTIQYNFTIQNNTIQYNTIPCISPGDFWHDCLREDQHRSGNTPGVRGKNRGVHQGENRGMLSQRFNLKV